MIYFIVNPAAGSGKGLRAAGIIERLMEGKGREFRVIKTIRPDDMDQVSAQIDWNAAELVVSVGGDGSAQEAVGLVIGRGIPFGVIPAGSGNDMIKSLPNDYARSGAKAEDFELNIAYYLGKALSGEARALDVIELSALRPDGSTYLSYSLNIASLGFDTQIVANTHSLKKRFGRASYFVSLLTTLVGYKSENYKVIADGRVSEGRLLLSAICNGRRYGGVFDIAPSARMDDGLLTLCLIKAMSRPKILFFFPRALRGRHITMPEVSFIDCQKAVYEFEGARLVNLDGNLVSLKGPLEFTVRKGAVKVVC
jgi:diacylglycerol kinase family enzyme